MKPIIHHQGSDCCHTCCLKIEDLSVRFGAEEALANVDLHMHCGQIVALIGPNGGGKSTLAKLIMGVERATSGQILLDGTDLLHLPRALLRARQGKEIGVVFQEPMSAMDPLMKVGTQVEETLLLHAKELTAAQRREKAIQALADVELPDPEGVYNKYPHELSGGMLQRAMIAAAIVTRPRLLLLDEPTTALDVTIQAQILELLKKLNREYGMSMLFISHNLRVVQKLCTHVAVMQRGRLVEEGLTDAIMQAPQQEYTRRLIAAIPTRNRPMARREDGCD